MQHVQSKSAALLRCWSHHRSHTAPPSTKTPAEQPVPQAADLFTIAGRQVVVILPVEGIASLYQDLYDRRVHPISLRACSTLTVLLRRTIRDHLCRVRPEKILTVFQQVHLRFFRACGLAAGCTSFAS